MVRLLDVCKVYENGTPALKGINLQIDDGEFVFLVGSSASGKSTLVKTLTSEVKMTSGRGIINGFNLNKIKDKDIPKLRRTIGIVFQDFRLIEKKSVYENVAFAMRAVGAPPRAIKKRVMYVLRLVGLDHKAACLPKQLSGGEQQRVAVARALVNNPRMIIADEPTGNLDPKMSMDIMRLLEQINALGTTILVVTHERELVNAFSKRVVAIGEGRIISDKTGGYYQDEIV
ncbi:MAG: cell division ATP-binding protein FtsE [Ruminococcaceae bacterium]|nr:cell division ATP-binding protein FtsE [Oscillospiraceae bacterium]